MPKYYKKFIVLLIALVVLLSACRNSQMPTVDIPPLPEETADSQSDYNTAADDVLSAVDPAMDDALSTDELPTDTVTPSQPDDDPAADDVVAGEAGSSSEPVIPACEVNENSFVWRVPPTLEYDKIYCCRDSRIFSTKDHAGYRIDAKTGQTIGLWSGSHCGSPMYLLYDEKRNLYGYYSGSEGVDFGLWSGDEFLKENAERYQNRLQVFQKIDSDKIIIIDREVETDYDFSEAYISEKYALAYGITFIADFIYDDYHLPGYVNNIIALKLNNKWGILDKDGNTIVPFCFDEVLLVEDGENAFAAFTAFVKYNGKYGILDINETAAKQFPNVQ